MYDVDVNEAVKLFAEQYYEKIFYFSLKKTGNQTEAEDLSADIALDIISALRKGTIPKSFSAYVWKCARSRYAKWVGKHVKDRANRKEINEDEDFQQKYNLENSYILQEDLKSLRRELALIAKDYREIIVSFYIDDKKVSQIADEFNLPEGTVKRKLFESRKILMEGMKMAREFGIRSYKPENVHLWTSGIGIDGNGPGPSYYSYNRKISKNILLEAYCNPSTIEELSLELGVAMPYMEEEVDILAGNELLRKLDDGRYETDFPILSADAQTQIEYAHLKYKYEYYSLLRKVMDSFFDKSRRNGEVLLGGYQTFEELKWMYMMLIGGRILYNIGLALKEKKGLNIPDKQLFTERSDGTLWDFGGKENFEKHEENVFVSHNGASVDRDGYDISNAQATFCLHHVHEFMKSKKRHFYYDNEQVDVIWDLYNGRENEDDRETIDFLVENGVFELKDGKYIPKFAVTNNYPIIPIDEDIVEFTGIDKSLYDEIETLYMKLYAEIESIINNDIPKKFQDKLIFERTKIFDINLHSYAIFAAIEDGYLQIPEDFSKSMIGAFLRVLKVC